MQTKKLLNTPWSISGLSLKSDATTRAQLWQLNSKLKRLAQIGLHVRLRIRGRLTGSTHYMKNTALRAGCSAPGSRNKAVQRQQRPCT